LSRSQARSDLESVTIYPQIRRLGRPITFKEPRCLLVRDGLAFILAQRSRKGARPKSEDHHR